MIKTIFDPVVRAELISRIESLCNKHQAQWGKMSGYQMTKHCTLYDEWYLGLKQPVYKHAFIGRIVGKMVLKNQTKNDQPLPKNMGTLDRLLVTESDGDLELQKQKWIELINSYENYANPYFIHDFFGKMTEEQIGILNYKHADHHLRQFNV